MPARKKKSKIVPSKNLQKKSRGGFGVMFFVIGAFVVVFVVLGSLFFIKPYSSTILTDKQIASYVDSATVQIPDFDTDVTLTDGKGVPDDEGSGYVNVTEPYFSVKTGNNVYDAFAVMEYNLGGSGVFTTVALFEVVDGHAVFKGSYPVGDRVPVTGITGPVQSDSGDYEVTVNYLEREPNQSMADAPTVFESVKLRVSNHEIMATK